MHYVSFYATCLECSSALRTTPSNRKIRLLSKLFYSRRKFSKVLTHNHNKIINFSIYPLLLWWWSFSTWELCTIVAWVYCVSTNLFTCLDMQQHWWVLFSSKLSVLHLQCSKEYKPREFIVFIINIYIYDYIYLSLISGQINIFELYFIACFVVYAREEGQC